MKKLFFLMAAAAALFTSCSKDDTIGGLSRGKVTFEVSAPELATRYGEGTTATTLQYAVYDMVENTTEGTLVDTGSATLNNKAANVAIDLVEGRTYSVIFWADAGTDSPYTFTPATKTVSYKNTSDLQANQESYDAFFAYVGKDKVKVGETVKVELKRPFAQLRIETSDKERAAQLGVNVEKTGITVNAYTSFNLETGVVDGKQELTFEPTTAASATTTVDGTTYDLISMNYLLVNNKEAVDVTLNFTDKISDTQEETYVRKYNAINIQRNYRTLVRGTILTDPTNFDVTVKEGFDGDYTADGNNSATQVVSTAQEIQDAIDNAANGTPTTIVLTDDLNLNDLISVNNTSTQLTTRAGSNDHITIPTGKQITIDLGGYNITGTDITEKNFGLIQNNGTLSITNSASTQSSIKLTATVNSGWARYSAVISNNPGGVLNVSGDILIEHLGGTDMAFGIDNLTNGTIGDVYATIEGATIKSTYRAVRQFLNSDSKENSLTIKSGTTLEGTNMGIFFHDPSTKANKGTLIVEDGANIGTAYLFVTAGSTEWPVEVSIAASSVNNDKANVTSKNVPAGYSIVLEDGNYVVKKGWYASSDDELQAALDNAPDGTTIYIAADIEGDVVATQKEGVKITIEGQNKSYKGMITVDGKSARYETAGLTIKDLKFDAESITGDACIRLGNGSTTTRDTNNVTVEGCTFDVPGAVGVKSYTGGDWNLTITGCTATTNAHSLAQLANVEKGLNIKDCKAYSKNGINLNQTVNVVIDNYTAEVRGYAVRFGASSGNAVAAETYLIKNSSLKTDNSEGDAVIVLRGTADNSTLTIENTTIEGNKQIDNSTTNAIVIIDGVPTVKSSAGLASVIAKNYTTINMTEGEYTVPDAAKGKTLTLNGQGGADKVVINVTGTDAGEGGGQLDPNFDGSTVTFNDLTIKTNSQLYAGFTRLSGTYNRCIIQNTYNLGTGNSAFYDCTINITNEYLRVGGASSAIFDGCTFNTDGRAILVFQDGTSVEQTVTVKDCTFNATAAANTWNGIHVAAVSIDGSQGGTYVVNLEGTNTVDSDFNGLWQIKAGEANVTVNE